MKYVSTPEAIEALKEGKRVGFRYWDPMTFIFMQVPANIPYEITQGMQSLPQTVKNELKKRYESITDEQDRDKFDIRYRKQIAMMRPDGEITGYSFSPNKILSNDG